MLEPILNNGSAITEDNVQIFISHSSKNKVLAKALISLILKEFHIHPKSIRCTSVDGFRLPTGNPINDTLRAEVIKSKIFIALLTPESLNSDFVLFELGARWAVMKPLFPLLAKSAKPDDLRGPLGALQATQCNSRTEFDHFLHQLSQILGIARIVPSVAHEEMDAFLAEAAKADSITPLPPSVAGIEAQSKILKGALSDSARTLRKRIESASMIERERLISKFKGCSVTWDVALSSARTNPDGMVSTLFTPLEPQGHDTPIMAMFEKDHFSPFENLTMGAKVKLKGTIAHISHFEIKLANSELRILDEDERSGSKAINLVPVIVSEVGVKVEEEEVLNLIEAKIKQGQPPGLRIEYGIIKPFIPEGSIPYKLLVKYCVMSLLRHRNATKHAISDLEAEIYNLEAYG